MTEAGTFNKVEKSDQRIYGERKVIVCGYPAMEHLLIQAVVRRTGITDLPIVFADETCLEKTLKEILTLPDMSGMAQNSKTRRAVILSGITHEELHLIMDSYRNIGLPGQLWATLTPTSEGWTLKELLDELSAEREAFRKKQSAA
jgi:hypothetical protein